MERVEGAFPWHRFRIGAVNVRGAVGNLGVGVQNFGQLLVFLLQVIDRA